MKIIGHRGASSLALENTRASLKAALEAQVYAIEFDVRLTKDKQLVLCHDLDLRFMIGEPSIIANHTLTALKQAAAKHDVELLSLDEALGLINERAVAIIELKDSGSVHALLSVLENHKAARFIIVSFELDELAVLRELEPSFKLYGLERTKPLDIIHFAKRLKLDGIGLNFWLLNPLTYWLAKRNQLEMYVYTVNHRWMIWFLHLLYPRVAICTNYPQWFKAHGGNS